MQNLISLLANKISSEQNSNSNGKNLLSLTTEKLKYVINTIDNKLFIAECRMHFESDKLQQDLKNWVDKERQKIHYLEETRHELLEKNMKKQTKIREIEDYMVWGRNKNEEIILENSSVLRDIKELQEKNRHLRRNFVILIDKTRKLERARREQLHTFRNLYTTTPKYKNKAEQTDKEVTSMVNTERRAHRGIKHREKGVQCEILAERARIIGHKGIMTDPIEHLIIFDDTLVVSESCISVTTGESRESLLTKSSECFEDCMQNIELLYNL